MSRSPAEQRIPELVLECGARLSDVRQAYHLDGTLNADGTNLVVVLHALTGSADAAGPERGWWREIIGPGKAIDTTRWAVLAPNLLGSCYGSTGPINWGGTPGDFPPVTTRDMARLVGLLIDELGVARPRLLVGGSLGGMVAMEWVLENPGSAEAAVVLAAPDAHPAMAIGWNHVQLEALRLCTELGVPDRGVALARQVAMLSFRTEEGLGERFARSSAADGSHHAWQVQEWLSHHGGALAARFDAETYRTLLMAMDSHDIARGRGDVGTVRRRLGAGVRELVAVGIPGDRLYGAETVRAWADGAGARYEEICSPHGHDAFLLETEQVSAILGRALPGSSAVPLADDTQTPTAGAR